MSSADRMLEVLSLFSIERSQLTVEEASELLGTTSSTTYRYFASLARVGLIAPSGEGRYIVGPGAIRLDWLMRNTDPVISVAKPQMKILASAIDEPMILLLCRLYRGEVMAMLRESICAPTFGSSYQRGRPIPLFSGATSKIILANITGRPLRRLIEQFEPEMVESGLGENAADIRKTLRKIRSEGVCTTSGELDKGLTGVAAPILYSDGTPIASLSFVLTDAQANQRTLENLSRLLKSAAAQISDMLPETK